jgi:hypothetical protein
VLSGARFYIAARAGRETRPLAMPLAGTGLAFARRMSRFLRPWYCVPPRRVLSFAPRRGARAMVEREPALVRPLVEVRRTRCGRGLRFLSAPPLRRYERLGRCSGLGPRGISSAATRSKRSEWTP